MTHLRWFDTHAHLNDPKYDTDRDTVIANAFDMNVRHVIEIGDGPEEWKRAKFVAAGHPGRVWWAGGLHPYYAEQDTNETWQAIKEFAKDPSFVAVGEIGLDYFKNTVPKETQISTFRKGIEIALETDKPIIIHSREAGEDTISVLSDYFSKQSPSSPGVAHCFSGSAKEAEALCKMGFYIGVDGPLTYPNAQGLRAVIQNIPLEKVVLETDSPYLPPQGFRGQRNTPAHIPVIGARLAELKNISVPDLANAAWENSFNLFRLNRHQ